MMRNVGRPAITAACCAILLLFIATTAAQTPTVGAEGTWRGTLNTGAASLRLVLRIARASDGLHTGSLDSLDQGSTIPIDSITVKGDTVRIELKVISGVFEGTLNAARTELTGTWTQGAPLPLTFTRDVTTPTPTPSPTPTTPITASTFPLGLPLEFRVPVPPTPFLGSDGKTYLAYEVHLTSFSARDLLLKRVDVLNGSTAIAGYEDNDLSGMIRLTGTLPGPDRRTITPGTRAIIFLWLPFDSPSAVPAQLRHRVTIGEATIEGGAISVSTQKPIVISPPLSGDGWMAGNGPGRASNHRRAIIPTEGGARIAQRFAIDWVQMTPAGGTFAGDQKDNKSYRAYGANALAVADATVAATKDGIPENVPGLNSRAVPITSETIGGNHVVLDLGGGRFAFYAHLQPGSLRVKVGDRVTRGQVVGLVGNSGNSTEPHLHFHISDGVSPLGSEGLPYSMTGMTGMTGMPLQNARVNFSK